MDNDAGADTWQWNLLTDIELLEEMLVEHRGLVDADDALAVYEVALSRALQQRRRQWRAMPAASQPGI